MRIPLLGVTLACLALPLALLAAQDHEQAGRGREHGRLGIMLDQQTADSLGASVRGVVPQGPADKAGIQRGDVIVRFNGTALNGSQKLMDLARQLQPGDSVKLEYRRGGQTRTTMVIADRMGPRFAMMFRRFPGAGFGLQAGPHMLMFRTFHPGGLALVPLSKDLGEYFGTSEGFLVLKPPADSASPLKAGDVILAIDGRKPQSVEHALKILGSYAPGEKARLDVMRKRQRTTLSWTAPERPHRAGEGSEGRPGMEPGEPGAQADAWGAIGDMGYMNDMSDMFGPMVDSMDGMDFDMPVPPPDMDFMLRVPPVPATALAQET